MQRITVKLENLFFDPNNFRYDDDFNSTNVPLSDTMKPSIQNNVRKKLIPEIKDLKQGILTNDFIYIETIIVKPLDEENYIVVEGNRRTATLKSLYEDYKVNEIDEKLVNLIDIFNNGIVVGLVDATIHDEDILMGMRHITGVKPWKAFSKAKLIVKLKEQRGYDFREIAEKLTGTASDIKKRYNALKLLENMINNDYDYENVSDLYNLFVEALGKPAFRDWLEYDEENIKFKNQTNLDRFYKWLIPFTNEVTGEEESAIITNPQALREVAQILKDESALEILEVERDVFKAVANSVILKDREVKKTLKKIYQSTSEISIPDLIDIDEGSIDYIIKIRSNMEEIYSYLKFKKVIED
jgi:hypothetical protein